MLIMTGMVVLIILWPCCNSEEEATVVIKGLKMGKEDGPAGVVGEMMKASGGSKQHSLQAVELSQWLQTAVEIVSNLPPQQWEPDLPFFGQTGHADTLAGYHFSVDVPLRI